MPIYIRGFIGSWSTWGQVEKCNLFFLSVIMAPGMEALIWEFACAAWIFGALIGAPGVMSLVGAIIWAVDKLRQLGILD